MKKLIVLLSALVLMPGCVHKTLRTVSDTDSMAVDAVAVDTVADAGVDKHSEAYIRQRMDTIYKTVGKTTYDHEGNEVDYIHNPFNRDSAYCSQRFYALSREALQFTDEMGIPLFDYDYWVCGQDYSDDWSCRVSKVYDVTDSAALVDLVIHNFSDTETTIALRFERGDWFIDDFSPSADGNDDKKYFRDIIREGLANREKAKSLVGYWGWVGDECPELLLRLEMTDNGLQVTECNIYRMYGFDKATASFNGTALSVYELEYDEEAMKVNHEFHLDVHMNKNGDLVGDCHIMHPLASKEYEGPITLRKDYFKYARGK